MRDGMRGRAGLCGPVKRPRPGGLGMRGGAAAARVGVLRPAIRSNIIVSSARYLRLGPDRIGAHSSRPLEFGAARGRRVRRAANEPPFFTASSCSINQTRASREPPGPAPREARYNFAATHRRFIALLAVSFSPRAPPPCFFNGPPDPPLSYSRGVALLGRLFGPSERDRGKSRRTSRIGAARPLPAVA